MRRIGRRHPVAMVALAAALVATGCGSAAPQRASLPAGLAPDHPLLTVDQWAGGPLWAAVDAPRRLTLTADGRLVVQDHSGATIYPRMTQTILDEAALAEAWAGAVASGLRNDGELPLPGVFDVGMTIIHTDDGSDRTELQAYALGWEGADASAAGIPERELAMRRSILTYTQALEGRTGSEPYLPPQVALWIGPAGDARAFQPVVPWTADGIDLAAIGNPVDDAFWERCIVLDGDAAATVATIGGQLPADAAVSQDGVAWRIGLRPIMPDEVGTVGCAATP